MHSLTKQISKNYFFFPSLSCLDEFCTTTIITAHSKFSSQKRIRKSSVIQLESYHYHSTTSPNRKVHQTNQFEEFSLSNLSGTGLKKFWKSVSISQTENGKDYVIKLDQRILKTPESNPIIISKESKTLAQLVAAEWANQDDKFLKAHNLPLTSILTRAIDSLRNVGAKHDVINQLIKYLHTDTILYHSEQPNTLVKMQEKHWMPLLKWIQNEYGVTLQITNGIIVFKQSDDAVKALSKLVFEFDFIQLAAFEKAVMASKSFIIGLALVKKRISVEDAAFAARLEVIHQISLWGEVEDAHDIEQEDLKRQLHAVCAVIGL